jgi:hypothetical protein
MSAEQPAFNKDKWLERKMAASRPVWNSRLGGKRGSVVLSTIPVDNGKPTHYYLSPREFDILELVTSGVMIKDISRMREITRSTVVGFLSSITRKIDVYGGRTPLLKKLVESGILRFEPRIQEEDWVGLNKGMSRTMTITAREKFDGSK